MDGDETRRRQGIDPAAVRQFVEPFAWITEPAPPVTANPARWTAANELAAQAQSLRAAGRFTDAVDAYDAALALFRVHGSARELVRCLFDRATCLHRLRSDNARESLALALAGYTEALLRLLHDDDPLALADCLLNLAACYEDWDTDPQTRSRLLDARALAGLHYQDALARYEALGAPADIAWCLMLRSNFLRKSGEIEQAITDLRLALNLLIITGSDPITRAQCMAHLANCLKIAHQPGDAFAMQLAARDLLAEMGESADDRRRSAAHVLALWHWQQGQAEAAWPFIVEATDLAEALAARAGHQAQLIDKRSQYVPSFQLAVRIAFDRDAIDDAFAFAQRAKGRTLAELLEERGDRVEARRPGLRHPRPLAEIAAALHPGEALLDTLAVDKDGALACFLILPGDERISWSRLIPGVELTEAVRAWDAARERYLDIFERYVDNARLRATLDERAHEERRPLAALGELLIGPIAPLLDAAGVTTLIISPGEPLHRLPLAAFLLTAASGKQEHLIDRYALQLIPTASSLAALRRPDAPPRADWPPALLAAAPFSIEAAIATDAAAGKRRDLSGRFLAPRDRRRGASAWPELPASGPEIAEIAALLRALGPAIPEPKLFLRETATRPAVVPEMPAARLVHLATHGGRPDRAQSLVEYTLFLAPDQEGVPGTLTVGEVSSGAITLDDVFAITLSACHLGEVVTKGAEALGFAQAFLSAGAGVILAPIWAVPDGPTAELMIAWYEQLTSDGRPDVAQAWRAAVQSLRRLDPLYAQPHFWAGFLPNGDGALHLGRA